MILNAAQLCKLLHGELVGDGERKIHGPSQIDKGRPGTVTFLANPKYEDHAYNTDASVLLVGRDFVPKVPLQATMIRVDDVYGAMMFIVEKFSQNGTPLPGIAETSVVDPTSRLAEDVSVGAFTCIERDCTIGAGVIIYPQVYIGHGTTIGEEVIIYPGVKIYPNTQIGDRCIIHANAVIGSDGFGYRPNEQGHYVKIKHVGIVIIEDDVEIGANTVIDRGTLAITRIGKGTKIDNLVQIAHNVTIGDHTAIAAQAGIAGSAVIGKHVQVGGQAGIAGHIKIADRIEIQAKSGVHTGKYPEGTKLFGYPAFHYMDYLKAYAAFKQLPDYIRRIEELERQIAATKKESE
ncbi:MAG TPA: UDP-3-O-(3-hydroxymyristoyl)glucosamine N-acyltransferase [Saprospiraceae bacterium]|nr:UDP-3-O-(3-hydroxymyristoyl)glucosamine N-acyltransferase [Saprospiraceae bacterium]